ncbi:hypothetical protein [Ruegeria lacuscaerulensis]|uniref:hypothetical protein n=1 Tax=Ruegeria lacuscaerulensis TaxID=55218 RepID=UPI001479E8E8|nr:hypothetical protein [Ruegeria lacuscaerulensis]
MNAKHQILNMAERLATTNAQGVERALVKKMLVGLRRVLPVADRQQFDGRADINYSCDFVGWDKRLPIPMTLTWKKWPAIGAVR